MRMIKISSRLRALCSLLAGRACSHGSERGGGGGCKDVRMQGCERVRMLRAVEQRRERARIARKMIVAAMLMVRCLWSDACGAMLVARMVRTVPVVPMVPVVQANRE